MALLEPLQLTDQRPHGRKHGCQGDGFYLMLLILSKKLSSVPISEYMLLKDHDNLNVTRLSSMLASSAAIYFLPK